MTRLWRALAAVACLMAGAELGGCGYADSQAKFVPAMFRDKAPEAAAAEPMPDVKALVRERRQELFAGTIDAVRVGPAHPKGTHWMFCVQAVGRGAGGQPLPPQVYLVEIERGVIGDRLPVDGAHWCAREQLEPA
jgi:hypothetical protein